MCSLRVTHFSLHFPAPSIRTTLNVHHNLPSKSLTTALVQQRMPFLSGFFRVASSSVAKSLRSLLKAGIVYHKPRGLTRAQDLQVYVYQAIMHLRLVLATSLHASGWVQSEQAVQAADAELGRLVDIIIVQPDQSIHPLLSWRLTR
jgi:predicted transcriptional regulator